MRSRVMTRLLRRSVAVLVLMMVALGGLAVDTDISVRVLSRDAKFVGSGMGGARVVLRNAQTGELLASGLAVGGTGETDMLMHDGRGRRAPLANDSAAAFRATLDLDRPTLIKAEVSGPRVTAGHAASATQWVVPGKHLSAGDGWVIELPGFVVSVLVPPAQRPTGESEDTLTIDAQVVMMCGCPITPGGLWDADQYEVGMMVSRDGGDTAEIRMTYTGTSSRFRGELPVAGAGTYDISVYAYDPRTGNTGVDTTTVIVD